jgi:uncharacterized protein YutE (UPF0331/DUF86 family)
MNSSTEADIMELAANTLISEGYTVVLQPASSALPKGLKGYSPDAIAIGKKPFLVIEVSREGQAATRISEIRSALEGNKDWELYVVLDRGKTSNPLGQESIDSIENLLKKIPIFAKDDTRAALLMCWASLEAFARAVEPSDFGRPQTPGRIVERLASLSYIVPSEAQLLRGLIDKRNAFVHGRLSVSVSRKEIDDFVELLESLARTARKPGTR